MWPQPRHASGHVIFGVWILACASQPQEQLRTQQAEIQVDERANQAPAWVLTTPRMQGFICAVGAVDPTFYRQDGIASASDAARNELARTVEVKVTALMVDVQDELGSSSDESFTQEVMGSVSDVVLSGAQVQKTWYDELGIVSRRGMTYALACMPTDASAQELAMKLGAVGEASDEGGAAKVEKLRARAAVAFEELERIEQEKHPDTAGTLK